MQINFFEYKIYKNKATLSLSCCKTFPILVKIGNYENVSCQIASIEFRHVYRISAYDENPSDMMQISGNILYNLVSTHVEFVLSYAGSNDVSYLVTRGS